MGQLQCQAATLHNIYAIIAGGQPSTCVRAALQSSRCPVVCATLSCIKIVVLTYKTRLAAEDALEFAARALRQYSIGSQDWSRLLDQQKAFAMGKHGKPLHMFKKCAKR